MLNRSGSEIRHTDLQVYSKVECLTIGIELRLHRMRYLTRLLSGGPAVLVHMILLQVKSENSWTALVIQDLTLAWQSSESLFMSMPDPAVNLSEWLKCIAEAPSPWSSSLKRIFSQKAFRAEHSNDVLGLLQTGRSRRPATKGYFICELCDLFLLKTIFCIVNIKQKFMGTAIRTVAKFGHPFALHVRPNSAL